MSASLVGSEMCIRDRRPWCPDLPHGEGPGFHRGERTSMKASGDVRVWPCLLYTSDAADDM
eukprot:8301038-Alexandrium_andersonii.AAC.1